MKVLVGQFQIRMLVLAKLFMDRDLFMNFMREVGLIILNFTYEKFDEEMQNIIGK